MSSDMTSVSFGSVPSISTEQWLAERARQAALELRDCVEVDANKLGGVPVLKGTRISVAQILAEIGEGQSIQAVADDFALDVAQVKKLVTGLAICIDRPLAK